MSSRADLEARLRALLSPFLARWFVDFAPDPLYEVEVKLKDVSAAAFAHMLRKLDTFAGWRAKFRATFSHTSPSPTGRTSPKARRAITSRRSAPSEVMRKAESLCRLSAV